MSELCSGIVDTSLDNVPTRSNVQVKGDGFFFGKYSKHIPRILRHQLISKLTNQYIRKYQKSLDYNIPDFDFKTNTSIYRFHGALLFVDISGFTVLSQKLKVDELKNQINAYFQKIVDIIHRFEGEIIKFAGDALFVVWQSSINDTGDAGFQDAAKAAVDQAAACGCTVNEECGNYAISLKTTRDSLFKTNALLKSIDKRRCSSFARSISDSSDKIASNGLDAPGSDMKKKGKRKEAAVTYLNVHAGLSVGLMAGVDVGAQDRFEYLLLGQPMSDVAVAEGDAGQGEVVVSPEAHLLLHGPTDSSTGYADAAAVQGKEGANGTNEVDAAEPALLLSCGCQRTHSGYFKLQSSFLCNIDHPSLQPPDPTHNAADLMISAEEYERLLDLQFEIEVNAQVAEELMAGYKAIRPAIEAQFTGVMEKVTGPSSTGADTVAAGNPTARDSPAKAVAEFAQREVAAEHFVTWAQRCLLDDIARHVHEVVRRDFAFHAESRDAPLDSFLTSPDCIQTMRQEINLSQCGCDGPNTERSNRPDARRNSTNISIYSKSSNISPIESPVNIPASTHSVSSAVPVGESFVSKLRQRTSLRSLWNVKKSRHDSLLNSDSSLDAELRSVIVLFISVKTGDVSVFIDPTRLSAATASATADSEQADSAAEEAAAAVAAGVQTCRVDSFHFLRRTTAEIEADKRLVNMFQGCMEVMTEVFLAKGGQLRQFIVDDKGTVCIGTFGLRGSVNYDNAAAAVDAADLIIARIQTLGLDASVGVTSGAAYCGLVGSSTRHEYAVMGPSTNLSARLMGRAAPGEILCDSAIRQRDRVHAYSSLGAIKAKGYSKPVPIFKPEIGTSNRKDQLSLELPDHSGGAVKIDASVAEVFGRDQEARHVLGFLFQDSVKGSLQTLWNTFWLPAVQESVDLLSDKLFALSSAELEVKATSSSKKKLLQLVLPERRGRFDITQPSKEAVVAAVNGMGKTAFLNLMQAKLNRLIAKNPESYNLAVFRHQVGVVNATTVFSGWFCLVQQTLFSIAACLAAETADPLATARLDALRNNDFRPIVEFLVAYLPTELQPYVPLLSNVGISLAPSHPTFVVTTAFTTVGQENVLSSVNATTATHAQGAAAGGESPTDSDDLDAIAALDPADCLRRCTELIVAIAQLHVTITRKVTVYIMDDLHQHDELSQKLGEHLASSTQGICLLCTVRSDVTTASPLAPSQSSSRFNATSKCVPPRYLRTELQPISQDICSALVSRIFAESGVVGVDEAVLAKLHAMSAGSPMYATELAKIVCHSYIHREESTAQQQEQRVASCGAQLMDIIDKLRADRIEEVVHFRFDKLSEQCQLVLKMAAVAGLNGSHFTLSMLAFILDCSKSIKTSLEYQSDLDDEDMGDEQAGLAISSLDLVQALSELLESDAFIESREPPSCNRDRLNSFPVPSPKAPDLPHLMDEGAPEKRSSVDSGSLSALQWLRFHWKVGMELRAIYDLMLDEQKESLHGRVASFAEQEQQIGDSNEPTATEWSELGFHWERATAWGAAMTCYYRAGMLLHAQGGSKASKAYFDTAFRMFDAMRQEAGVQSLAQNHHPYVQVSAVEGALFLSDWERLVALLSQETTSKVDMAALMTENVEHVLSGRNVALRAVDLHRMFEQSSELLYTGLSVMVCLAQTMLYPEPTDLAFYLFENALDMVYVLRFSAEALTDADGGTFGLRKLDICFQIYSGVFFLLLHDYAFKTDDRRIERMVAIILRVIDLARSSPEYEVHLLKALVNKRRLMESCLLQAPQLAEQIVACTGDIHRLYQRDKHSQKLMNSYKSDHVASGTCGAAKVLCLQGRFAEMHTHLECAHQHSAKIKHFFSYACGTIGAYSIYLCYLPDVQAQLIYKELQRKHQLARTEDFRVAAPLFVEGIAQYLRFAQYRATGEDNVFDSDSAFVEELLQSRQLVQDKQDNHNLYIARMYYTGLEFIAARICYLKALRFDLQYARDRSDRALSLLLSYAKLGLLHLTFTATQRAKNETLVFSDLHEKLLRAQLLLLVLKYSAGDPAAVPTATVSPFDGSIAVKAAWAEIHRDLTYCCGVAQRGEYHTILFQVGTLLQALGRSHTSEEQGGVSESEEQRMRDEGTAMQRNALNALRACNAATEGDWIGMLAAALVVPEEQL